MIFRRKKPSTTPGDGQPALRGRDSAENSSNPLARRFHPEDEPDTIDLQQPAGFSEEPGTAETGVSPAQPAPAVPEYLSVVTVDPGTDKFYVQPGQGDSTVYLGDEVVRAPTELRRGDCVRVGDFELQILPGQKSRE
jgi:hypothetical protein